MQKKADEDLSTIERPTKDPLPMPVGHPRDLRRHGSAQAQRASLPDTARSAAGVSAGGAWVGK
jgi:hypothetical protein